MKTLQQQLSDINASALHNMRFLLEAYSKEVLEAIDRHVLFQQHDQSFLVKEIQHEVASIMDTLKSVETAIQQHTGDTNEDS